MTDIKCLNGAQVAAVAYLFALGPIWVKYQTKWVDILDSSDDFGGRYVIRVKLQIASSLLRGYVYMNKTDDGVWILDGMESQLSLTKGPGGVRFGLNRESGLVEAETI